MQTGNTNFQVETIGKDISMFPASNHWYFNLVDVNKSKPVFLNDFSWNEKVIL